MAHEITIHVADEAATKQLAAALAKHLRPGDTVLLDGALAAGKTFFTKALAAELGCTETVTSPTYAIANIYEAPNFSILHVDAYRLKSARDFHMLGLEDYLENGVSIIEWGERVRDIVEAPLDIRIGFGNADEARVFTLTSLAPRWAPVLEALQ